MGIIENFSFQETQKEYFHKDGLFRVQKNIFGKNKVSRNRINYYIYRMFHFKIVIGLGQLFKILIQFFHQNLTSIL